jgi:hypothetical protein
VSEHLAPKSIDAKGILLQLLVYAGLLSAAIAVGYNFAPKNSFDIRASSTAPATTPVPGNIHAQVAVTPETLADALNQSQSLRTLDAVGTCSEISVDIPNLWRVTAAYAVEHGLAIMPDPQTLHFYVYENGTPKEVSYNLFREGVDPSMRLYTKDGMIFCVTP